jgi:glutaredoxin 3
MPSPVTIYTTPWCGYCARAKALLTRKGVAYTEIDVEGRRELREQMIARSGRRTVPQVFIGEHHVGGSDDLAALEATGELDRLLAQAGALQQIPSTTDTTETRT